MFASLISTPAKNLSYNNYLDILIFLMSLIDPGCWILDVGYWVLDIEKARSIPPYSPLDRGGK